MADRPPSGPADYLAAERTFLAWIRTGLALMGLGFVVSRFWLFLQELQIGPTNLHVQSYGLTFWLGTALIVLGVVVNVASAWSHFRLVQKLRSGGPAYDRPSWLAMAVALTLALVGLTMAIYLVSVRESTKANPPKIPEKSMTSNAENGVVNLPSRHSVEQTVAKLEQILQAKGVKLFALIDHSGEAEKAGMHMPPTKLLIFGNPKGGTPLMIATPSVAIDLPLKILVSEDVEGKVWISYDSPAYLQTRHGFPPDLLPNIAVEEALAKSAAE